MIPTNAPFRAQVGEVTSLDVDFRKLGGRLPSEDGLHSLYPYPARLLRQIPRHLLAEQRVTNGVDRIVDPFCGSGTVLLEGQRVGMNGVGFDQNPIAALVARVKVMPPSPGDFEDASVAVLSAAKRSRQTYRQSALLARWLSDQDLLGTARLRAEIERADVPETLRETLQVVLALVVRKVANTDPRIPVPVRPRFSREGTHNLWTEWAREASRVQRLIATSGKAAAKVDIHHADARKSAAWDTLRDGAPFLTFTSPPYGTAQKYLRSTSLEHALLDGPDFEGTASFQRGSIGRERVLRAETDELQAWTPPRQVDKWLALIDERDPSRGLLYRAYFRDMQTVFARMTGPSLNCIRLIMIAGANHVAGMSVPTYSILRGLAADVGFEMRESMRDEIRGRALLTSRRSVAEPASHEWIEVFERNG